jgi:hypothetical protein
MQGPEILIPLAFFGFIYAVMKMKHQARIAELQAIRGQGAGTEVASEIRKLQEQIHELRDTTTRYDMSFDAALQRLESRVSHLETQQRQSSSQVNLSHPGA